VDHFRDRPEDLLILDICGGEEGWKELCSFLDAPLPHVPFPKSNVSKQWPIIYDWPHRLLQFYRDLSNHFSQDRQKLNE
jgi:hypothetical protein